MTMIFSSAGKDFPGMGTCSEHFFAETEVLLIQHMELHASMADQEDREQEWLARQYVANPKAPLRFYMEAGWFETDLMMPDGFSINLLASNRHFRDILQAKEYPVISREVSGGHSTLIWRGTFADGLLALLGRDAFGNGISLEPNRWNIDAL